MYIQVHVHTGKYMYIQVHVHTGIQVMNTFIFNTEITYQTGFIISMTQSSSMSMSTCVNISSFGQENSVEFTQYYLRVDEEHDIRIGL